MAELTDPYRLSALRETDLLDSPPEEEFDRVTRIAAKILDVPVALVSLVEGDRQFYKSQIGLPDLLAAERQTPMSHSFCQHVVTSEEVFAVSDARSDPRVRNNLAVRDYAVVAYLGVPLKVPDGAVVGSLCAVGFAPRVWSDDDIAALRDLSHVVMDQIALRAEIMRRADAERQQQLLIAELHHRVKNTLAVVQSMINLSLRTTPDLPTFRQSIGARIAALANTHTLLIDKQWVSASLTDVLATELAAQGQAGRITLEGPEVRLPAQLAVTLGMCAHELMTNAVKYGALSTPAGRVAVSWTIEDGTAGERLRLGWVESGGPPVTAPRHRGFGSMLLERLVGQQSDGHVSLDYAPAGLRATITTPVPKAG